MIRKGLLLAAGASRRFGPGDKLLALKDGKPLVAHAASALRGAGLDECIAVIVDPALVPHLDGFTIVVIEPGEQSHSLRAGAGAAGQPDRLLIALGDMPAVTSHHLRQVIGRAVDDGPSASIDQGHPMPPACFPRTWLPRLAGLAGDRGAGLLIRDLPRHALVPAPGLLIDVDRPGDLATEKGAAPPGRPS